jgi:hypothetical protein
MDQYFPNSETVVVDGEQFIVREISPGTYQSMPNDPDLAWIIAYDATTWARNARAIEISTGCPVLPASIRNEGNNTIAAAGC